MIIIQDLTNEQLIELKDNITKEQKRRERLEYTNFVNNFMKALGALAEKYPNADCFNDFDGRNVTWEELYKDIYWYD